MTDLYKSVGLSYGSTKVGEVLWDKHRGMEVTVVNDLDIQIFGRHQDGLERFVFKKELLRANSPLRPNGKRKSKR